MNMLRRNNKPVALAISGLDPSGGAGLIADMRTFSAFGVHGLGIVSAETAQNCAGVAAIWPRPLGAFRQQLDLLCAEFRPAATKIGLAGSVGQLRLIRRLAASGALGELVVDPVLVASRGQTLIDDQQRAALLDLFAVTSVLTPNLPELAALTNRSVNSVPRLCSAAHALLERGVAAVLVKGGHTRGAVIIDRLITQTEVFEFAHDRLPLPKTHGTGCHVSSALAARLAAGTPLPDACADAIAWTHQALAQGSDFGPTGVRYLDDSITPKKTHAPRSRTASNR